MRIIFHSESCAMQWSCFPLCLSREVSTRKDTTLLTYHLRASMERLLLFLSEEIEQSIKSQQPLFILSLLPQHGTPAGSTSGAFSPTKWWLWVLAWPVRFGSPKLGLKPWTDMESNSTSGGMIARMFLRLLNASLSAHVKAAVTLAEAPSVTDTAERSWKIGHPLRSTWHGHAPTQQYQPGRNCAKKPNLKLAWTETESESWCINVRTKPKDYPTMDQSDNSRGYKIWKSGEAHLLMQQNHKLMFCATQVTLENCCIIFK